MRWDPRLPGLAAASVLLGLAAAGCGGSHAPSVANLTTTGTSRAADGKHGGRAAFAACMTSHGFTAVIGGGGNVSVAGVTFSDVDPQSSQFQSAMGACRSDLPGGGPPQLSPSQLAAWLRAMDRFAGCIRKHGIPSFPDPSSSGTFSGAVANIDPTSPTVQRAFRACVSLEPTVGPRVAF